MVKELLEKREKKVEYIELIYDLIFVYIIGRNNLLLHDFENGFVALPAFFAYVMTTLAVIQIWNYTTYYINIYGRHGVREHVFLFVNMFLLYFIGQSTRSDWQRFHTQYHVAWVLILVNVGLQYVFELARRKEDKEIKKQLLRMACVLFGEAGVAALDIPVFRATGTVWLSLAAIVFGMAGALLCGRISRAGTVDFPHLSERAMLYAVFTFGEMIIGAAAYFEGAFSWRGAYFALMAFLIVVGLFLSYGVFYDRILHREKQTNGLMYMLLHIFIIFAMNNVTNGLQFMREEEIRLLPKLIFLIGSLLLFFAILFALGGRFRKPGARGWGRLCLTAAPPCAAFILLMLLLRESMPVNIAVTAAFVFTVFAMLRRYGRKTEAQTQ